MTFGQQPQGNNANGFNGQPYGQNQYNPNQNSYGQYSQNPYGQNQYQYAPQNMYAQGAPAATIPAQATYSYERAEHASVTRAYGEMTIGLLVTAAVAILTQATGAYIALIQSLGVIGAWAPFVVEIVIAIYLGARIEKIKPSTARVMFYVYAAIMGFSLSTIFMAYDLGTIGISLALCAGFFFALTMLGHDHQGQHAQSRSDSAGRPHRADRRRSAAYDLRSRTDHAVWLSPPSARAVRGMTSYDAQATRASVPPVRRPW